MELPKHYNFKESEKKWIEYWKKESIFVFDEQSKKPVFSIDTPPPYVSAAHLHVGHTIHYTQFEFIARYKRMNGFNVFFPMGFDDNGLPTERFVEKKYKINKSKVTRHEFVKLCLEETKKGIQTYKKLWDSIGMSVDWNLTFSTINPLSVSVAQKSFLDLYKKNRIVREDNPVMWDVKLQSSVAQADLESVDLKSVFNDIIFKCNDKDLIISTTRPELLPACVGLFFHPDDERYSSLKGKFAKVPLFNYEVPILCDKSVEKDKGTGLMMVCTFGDKEDIEKWKKYNLELKIVLNQNGTMNNRADKYEGLKIKDARKRILEDLKKENLLLKQEDIVHAVNVSERSGAEVEFLKSPQWIVKILDKKNELIELNKKINWYPNHMKIRYEHWVKNLNWDWNISRQRYYGVPFPVWYSKKTGEVILADEDQLPVDPSKDFPKKLPKDHTKEDLIPEKDVMDTWMTSSCTPLINKKWGKNDEREKIYPMSLRPQAHDIIRTWAFYTIAKSLFHHNSIPWNNVMISGHGLDSKGKKMSKSKGNVIFPEEVIEKYSADSLRFLAASVKLGEDIPFQEKELITGKKTVTKLWNAIKFTIMNLEGYKKEKPKKLQPIDKWILSKLQSLVKTCTEAFDNFEYSRTRFETDNFFWQNYCDYYLEVVKDRIYNKDNYEKDSVLSAQHTLYTVSLAILKLFSPIMPFITEELYQLYYKEFEKSESIAVSEWPEFDKKLVDEKTEKKGDVVVQIIGAVRKFKSDKQFSLKKEVSKITIKSKENIKDFLEDIKAVCNSKEVVVGDAKISVSEELFVDVEE